MNKIGYDISQLSTDFFRTESGKNYIEFASKHLRSGKEALFDANFSGTMNEPICYESIIAIPIMNQGYLQASSYYCIWISTIFHLTASN